MELSMVDENMEAASDSHGFPGDEDIEIDLDIYQDHIDNDDEDVVVEDASATASDHPDISEDIHDVMSDADMVDKVDDEFLSGEVPDGEATSNKGESHGGGDGNGNGNGNGVVVTQPDQDTYTSTMEDDYDEDIDAPIPDDYIHEQPIDNEALSLEPNMPAEEGHSPPQDDHSQHIQSTKTEFDYAPQIAQQELDNDNYPPALRHGVGIQDYPEESYEEETASGNPQGTTGDDAAEFQLTRQPAEDGEAEIPSAEPHFSLQNANERHSAVAEEYQQETIGEAEEDVSFALEEKRRQATEESINEAANAAQSEDQKETEIKTGDHEAQYPLHRVTVLYQEDEMSLFPPHESDPSELYLLEDEELAYVPLRHLFQAFRGVLGNYVSEDNELVMLIDSLYVQLSELAIQRSEVTLSDIVQIYVDLSRIDGAENPEPLYINLGFKPTLESEVAALRDSVRQGKGLSSLGEWDEADEEASGNEQSESVADAEELKAQSVTSEENKPQSPKDSDKSFALNETLLHKHSINVEAEELRQEIEGDPKFSGAKQVLNSESPGSEASELKEENSTTNFPQEDDYEEQSYSQEQGDYQEQGDDQEQGDHQEQGDDQEQEISWQGEEHISTAGVSGHQDGNINAPLGHMATLPTENDQSGGAEPEDGEISTYDNNLSDVKPENEERPNSPRAEELAPITDGATTSADAPVTDRQQEAHIEEGRGYDEVGGIVHTLDSDGSDADLQEQEAPNHTVQIEDIQDSTSVQEQGQERPATPISNLDVLDIDADIFKSPIVEQREPMKPVSTNVQFADGSNAFADDSAAKHVYHVSTLDTTRDEFAEWDLVESGLSGQEDQFSTLDASPKVAKRPRVDDEINDHLNSAPDLKRHRSQ